MARASKAPKLVLSDSSQSNYYGSVMESDSIIVTELDMLTGEKPRDEYFQETLQLMNAAYDAITESGESPTSLFVLTRGEYPQVLSNQSLSVV